ncbi:hypothetical protein K504DRAFT_539191 [Pleomassaria siparia CBS 279.74]|uniref:Conserved oligomeric Golgi complex subunit 2 n=1 Tax=Pleomassaria siparia CBS 279.74 TaxID=1314801 RepID=A0A6G1JRS8_9PLEO|nr:hypothetical protein K504DRAFT_539191 [Pleomassaria siparia CBS 279.74]
MSRFYLESPTSTATPSVNNSDTDTDDDEDDDDDNLPYPLPLQRNDFLAPDFSPSTYLSTLHNRHQTLEDLRSELRSRSQLLSKELLDLVNANYADFLGLGRSLKNGDERVEEVRVGLLGFRKEVEIVRGKVEGKVDEVEEALEERRDIRKGIVLGRKLVEFEGRLKVLEDQLMVEMAGKKEGEDEDGDTEDEEDDDEDDEDEDEDEDGSFGVSIAKLRRHVQQWGLIQEIEKGVGEHPFIAAQAPRMTKVRNTLLLDLSTALKQARSAGTSGTDRIMKIMLIYANMGESAEAVKVLKSLKAT